MAIVKKEETLAFSMKIPRSLHDEVDRVRKEAKKVGGTYDPMPSLIRALRKDIAAADAQIAAAKEEQKKIKAD